MTGGARKATTFNGAFCLSDILWLEWQGPQKRQQVGGTRQIGGGAARIREIPTVGFADGAPARPRKIAGRASRHWLPRVATEDRLTHVARLEHKLTHQVLEATAACELDDSSEDSVPVVRIRLVSRRTILRLGDHADDFGSAARPRAFIAGKGQVA